ncbi:MAG TPA: hypothetical protein VGL70_21680 [Candidatus Binatia bacterium]|jgi:hypothetical protein
MSGKFIVNPGVEKDLIQWVASEYPDTATNSLICSIRSMSALTKYSEDIVKDAIRTGSLFAYDASGYFTDADAQRGRALRAISHVDTVMAWKQVKDFSVATARQNNAARLNAHRMMTDHITDVSSGSAMITDPSSGSGWIMK